MDEQEAWRRCEPRRFQWRASAAGVVAALALLVALSLWPTGVAPVAKAAAPAKVAATAASSAAQVAPVVAPTAGWQARLQAELPLRAAALALLLAGLVLGRDAACQWRLGLVCIRVQQARRIRQRGLKERPDPAAAKDGGQPERPWHTSLMPSQKQFVEQFVSELLRRDHAVLSAKLLAVRGVWGSGKSTLIQAMFSALHQRDDTRRELVPVYLNAWREESADDLHYRVVSTLAQHPRVFACAGARLSPRLLNRMAFDRIGWWPWRLKELTTTVKAAWKGGRADTEGNASAKWELPAPLDFQPDLERIVSALLEHGLQLVLFVDEIERGSREAAQAMVVLLRRSFDLPGVHLVVPFVPRIMDAAVFNPVGQMGPELRAAAEAVLYADAGLRGQAMATVGQKLGELLQSADLKLPAAGAAAPAAAAAGSSTGALAAVGLSEPALHGMFSAHLLRSYLAQDEVRREVLLNRMQEKYFGSMRMVPQPSANDLAAFVLTNQWLVEQAEPGLARLLAASVKTDGQPLPDDQARQAVRAFFSAAGSRRLLVDALRPLIEAEGQQDEPLRLLSAGNFSVRSFEGELRMLFDRFAGAEDAWRMLLESGGGAEGLAMEAPEQILAEVLAQAMVAAVAMLWLKMGDGGAGHGG